MKSRYTLLLFIASGLIFTISCEYQLDSENFRNIPKPDPSTAIHIELLPTDTSFTLSYPVWAHYNVNTLGLEIYHVQVFVDDYSIFESDQAADSFYLDPYSYEKGNRILTLAVTTESNSQSLADLVGYEGLVFMKQWEIYNIGCCPKSARITRIFNDDGVLRLEWDTITVPGFQKYRVYVFYPGADPYFYPQIIAEFSDPGQNFCYDRAYLGGYAEYWVETVTQNQTIGGIQFEIEYPFPTLDTLWLRSDSALLCWNKSSFYKGVSMYMITSSASEEYDIINNISDTTFVVHGLRLGKPVDYRLWLGAKCNYLSYYEWTNLKSHLSLGIGKLIPSFTKFYGIITAPRVFLQTSYSTVSRRSFPDMNEENHFPVYYQNGWSSTPDDRYVFTRYKNTIRKHDPATMMIISTYDTTQIGADSLGAVSIQGTTLLSKNNGVCLFNLITDQYVFSDNNLELKGAVISPDGEYTFTRKPLNNVWEVIVSRVTADSLQELWRLPENNYSVVKWAPDSYPLLIGLEGDEFLESPFDPDNVINLFSPVDNVPLYRFNVKRAHFGGIDPHSGLLCIWDEIYTNKLKNRLYLYNYLTNTLIHSVNLSHDSEELTLYRSYILYGTGYCLSVNSL